MNSAKIAVVIPHFQRKKGLLINALQSVFNQTISDKVLVIVVDDDSPSPAYDDVSLIDEQYKARISVIKRKNGGAGAARNTALDHVPDGVEFVAFLDSDDAWRPKHLENALLGLSQGYEAYFSDWWSFNYPEQTNFERIQSINPVNHKIISGSNCIYELGMSAIEHIIGDGGGVIQTSTVVYRYDKYKNLRFREEFYNGQDFFFWMDLGELGARFVFCTETGCDNGEGINIYQSAGWGTERSLQRIRNEIFVWTSANRFYALPKKLKARNDKKIRGLEMSAIRDVMYRIKRRLPVRADILMDIFRLDPFFAIRAPLAPFKVVLEKLFDKN